MMLQTLLTIVLLSCGDAAVVHRRDARSPFLNLRGGAKEERQKSLLIAQTGKQRFGGLPAMDKVVDTLLAGVGLAGTFAVMGAVEAKFGGVKLFVPPMSERQHPIVKMP